MHERRGEKLLSIVANMKDAYMAGQSKIEALWRTLIVDSWVEENSIDGFMWGKFESPAPNFKFGEWLAWTAARWHHQEQRSTRQQHPSKTSQETIMLLNRLCESDGGALLHPVEDIYEMVERPDLLDTFCGSELFRLYQTLFVQIPHARFFTTKMGYMGTGPLSLQDGDSVWLVPGSRTLFVLRDRPGVNRYEFVGDCYVHGVMQGQAAKDLKPNMEMIELELFSSEGRDSSFGSCRFGDSALMMQHLLAILDVASSPFFVGASIETCLDLLIQVLPRLLHTHRLYEYIPAKVPNNTHWLTSHTWKSLQSLNPGWLFLGIHIVWGIILLTPLHHPIKVTALLYDVKIWPWQIPGGLRLSCTYPHQHPHRTSASAV